MSSKVDADPSPSEPAGVPQLELLPIPPLPLPCDPPPAWIMPEFTSGPQRRRGPDRPKPALPEEVVGRLRRVNGRWWDGNARLPMHLDRFAVYEVRFRHWCRRVLDRLRNYCRRPGRPPGGEASP